MQPLVAVRPATRFRETTVQEFLLFGQVNGIDVSRNFWWRAVPAELLDALEAGEYKDNISATGRVGSADLAVPQESPPSVVALRARLGHLLGLNANATTFLSQALYWDKLTKSRGFFHTREQWHAETVLTRTEQETARKKLRNLGILVESPNGKLNRTYYRIDHQRLKELLGDAYEQLVGIPPTITAESAGNPPTSRQDSDQQMAGIQPTVGGKAADRKDLEKKKEKTTTEKNAREAGGGEFQSIITTAKTSQGEPHPDDPPVGAEVALAELGSRPEHFSAKFLGWYYGDSSGRYYAKMMGQECYECLVLSKDPESGRVTSRYSVTHEHHTDACEQRYRPLRPKERNAFAELMEMYDQHVQYLGPPSQMVIDDMRRILDSSDYRNKVPRFEDILAFISDAFEIAYYEKARTWSFVAAVMKRHVDGPDPVKTIRDELQRWWDREDAGELNL